MTHASNVHDPELNVVKAVIERQSFGGSLFHGLQGEYFRDKGYGMLWDYLREHQRAYGKVPDQTTVLKDHPEFKDYLLRARPVEPPEFYADQILESFTKRNVADGLMGIVPKLDTGVNEGLDEIAKLVAETRNVRNRVTVTTLGNSGRERWDLYKTERVYGVSWGWETLDNASLGAHPGDLVLFAARPGQGKTFLTIYNSHVAWKEDHRVLVIATEVPPLKMLQRLDAIHFRLDYNLFKQHILATEVERAYQSYLLEDDEAKDRYSIVHGTGLTPSAIGALIEQVKPDIVYIDSVHKLEPDRRYKERWEKMAHLANELKDQVAQRYKVPVVCNTHFNREVGSGFGKRALEGSLENIAGGDEWGKVCDLAVGLSRKDDERQEHAAKLTIFKGRETEDGKFFHVKFDFSNMDFSETTLAHEEEEQAMEEGRKEFKREGKW